MLAAVADSFLRSCVHLICHGHTRARREQSDPLSAWAALRLPTDVDRFWSGAAMVMVGGRLRELSEVRGLGQRSPNPQH